MGPGTMCSFNRRNFAGPWVTSVGGTTGIRPEVGSKTSGGVFSTFFDREEYRNDAVTTYLREL